METIQQEFSDMGLNIKTDLEILTELLQRYNTTPAHDMSVDERVNLLTDFEYYLHQVIW